MSAMSAMSWPANIVISIAVVIFLVLMFWGWPWQWGKGPCGHSRKECEKKCKKDKDEGCS